MNRMWKLLPELEGEEMRTVEYAIRDLSDEEAESFAHILLQWFDYSKISSQFPQVFI